MSHILTTLYSFILSNPLGHQAPYLVYICHLETHRCGWLSFGIICQSIKIFDKRFNFFESVIFTLVSILDVAILSPPLQQNTCFSTFIFILSSQVPFFNRVMQFSDSQSFVVTLRLFPILIYTPHWSIYAIPKLSNSPNSATSIAFPNFPLSSYFSSAI